MRGDIVMSGYWDNPEATAAAIRNGWLLTGHIGRFDEGGYLYLLVCVIGIPDEYWGEAVHAVVVREPGSTPIPGELIDFCGAQPAGYKK